VRADNAPTVDETARFRVATTNPEKDSGNLMTVSLRSPRTRGLLALLAALVCGLACASVAQAASAPIITTFAGGSEGYTGDGGPATDARLYRPQGVAVDASGNVFIADSRNNLVREVNAQTGIITTIAGSAGGPGGDSGDGGPATSAELSNPTGVAVDASGNLFIADSGNNVVREVNAQTGIITTVAGDGTPGYSGDGGPATSAQLNGPLGVALDASGNLFIADDDNNAIREVNAQTGDITTVAGNGDWGSSGEGGPATSAELSDPTGVAVDASGNLFIANPGDNTVREVSAQTGDMTIVAGSGTGGDGGPATSASLNDPFGVTVDASGNVFIADSGDRLIREVNASTGIITTVAGDGTPGYSGDGGPATSAELSFPAGVAVDAHGNVFIADYGNNAVREVTSPAAISVGQSSFDFGSWDIGQSTTTTVTVTNTGGENLNVGQATLGGANAGQFAITADTCSGGTVAGGDSCTVDVQYSPTVRGAQTAELDIPSNDPNSPEVVSITGTGLLPATVSPDRTSNDFGAVTVGQNSATTFTVTNTGDRPLPIRQVSLGGADGSQFAIVSNTCPVALPLAIIQPATPPGIPAGGTCTISVQFNPTAVGAQTAELDITKSGSGTPTVITLSGTGAAVAQPAPPAPPTKSIQPTQPTQPTPQPKLIAQVSNLGQPAGAQQLLSGGEKERVYCNQACSLNVTLEVYYRAIARGKHYRGLLHAQTARTQPWTRVNVGQATVKMTAAGYEVVSVKVAAHKQVVADAGSILLGVYTHSGNALVSKHWMQVKGPDMNALVQALNSQS
jgi:hypothetical protein